MIRMSLFILLVERLHGWISNLRLSILVSYHDIRRIKLGLYI
jgi:hypothetical protein